MPDVSGGECSRWLVLRSSRVADRAGDRRRRAGAQGFLHRPQRLLVVAGLDQDQAGRIEAERARP